MIYYKNSSELYHHGILGQKWGIRRYQNKDGTLTDAGKKRYSVNDFQNDIKREVTSQKARVSDIQTKGNQLVELANHTSEIYEKGLKALLDDPTFEKKIKDYKKQLGINPSKKYDPWSDEYDALKNFVDSQIPNKKEFKKNYDNFIKLDEEYWNDIETLSNEIINKYEDVKISNFDGDATRIGRSAVYQTVDTRFNSYLSRHFEDYWLDDLDVKSKIEAKYFKEFR